MVKINVYDNTGKELDAVTANVVHSQLFRIDHSKTRYFRPDGSELFFTTEQAINADFGNIYLWAEAFGLSHRVAFRMFGKFSWMPNYTVKTGAVTAMHQRILEAAHACGYRKQLIVDGWIKE